MRLEAEEAEEAVRAVELELNCYLPGNRFLGPPGCMGEVGRP